MADAFTPSLRLDQQLVGGNNNIWGGILNTQIGLIESSITGDNGYVGGGGGINVGGLTTWTLTVAQGTADQARHQLLPFVGALTADCVVTIPGVVKIGWALNATTGGHNIVLKVGSGGTLTLPPSGWTLYYCDGVNVTAPALNAGTPVGAMMAFAGATAPSRWMLCYGQAVSRTTYGSLFSVIGGYYGVGDGSTTFNLPDMRGCAAIGADNMGGVAAGRVTTAGSGVNASAIGVHGGNQLIHQHYHTIADPGHAHGVYDPQHIHGVGDPGHVHAISDPGHVHGVSDPGHAHAIADPGHAHGYTAPILTSPGGSGANGFLAATTGATTGGSGTGIGIYASVTGVGIALNGANLGLYAAATGVYLGYAPTNIGIYGAFTGINATTNSGGGLSQNMSPVLVTNYIIYAGI